MDEKFVQLYYSKVFGISHDEALKSEYKADAEKAVYAVWLRKEPFEGETKKQAKERWMLLSPEEGNIQELSTHFVKVFPEAFNNAHPWEIIFEMYKRMKLAGEVPESSDIKLFKEDINMSQNLENLEKLNQKLEGDAKAASDFTPTEGNMPSSGTVTPQTMDAARDVFGKQMKTRIAYAKKTVASKIVLTKPAQIEVLVNGANSTGTIKDVADVETKFVKKTGMTFEGSEMVFKNIPVDQYDDAKKMYAAIQEAKGDPEKEFPVFFSNATPSIAGIELVEDGAKAKFIKKEDAVRTIIDKSAKMLRTPVSGLQIVLQKVTQRQNNGTKGAGAVKSKGNPFAGVVSMRFTQKMADVVENNNIVVYYKAIDKSKQSKEVGPKSDLKVKYYGKTLTADGDKKLLTYRMPLEAVQYALVATPGMEVFESQRLGGNTTPAVIDLNDANAIEDIKAQLTEIAAIASARGGAEKSEILAGIRAAAAEAEATAEAKQAADLGGQM